MRRALAILKYAPAVLCGLLVVAWVVSAYWSFGICLPDGSGRQLVIGFGGPYLDAGYIQQKSDHLYWCEKYRSPKYRGHRPIEAVLLVNDNGSIRFAAFICPYPFALSVLLPAALMSCLTRFRFPLWSYFAWTALIATELAYYLR